MALPSYLGNLKLDEHIDNTVKAPISLDCDCFVTVGDRHREWVAKKSRNSSQ